MSDVMATVEQIVTTYAIDGADAIEMAQALDYHVVVKKGEFKKGDSVIYVRVDSILPDGLPSELATKYATLKKEHSKAAGDRIAELEIEMSSILTQNTRPEFEFLRSKKFRIKAMKYGRFNDATGNPIVSQGIMFPISILPDQSQKELGSDVTTILGITKVVEDVEEAGLVKNSDEIENNTKIEKVLDKFFMRYSIYRNLKKQLKGTAIKGTWQDWMPPQSDEENIQKLFTKLKEKFGDDNGWYVSEKMEGQSCSAYKLTTTKLFGLKKNIHFGVCSRSRHLKTDDGSQFWKTIRLLDFEQKLKRIENDYFIRGEHCGAKIQDNIYKFPTHRVMLYDVWDIKAQRKLNLNEMKLFCTVYGFETCPILDENFKLPNTVQELLAYSNGKSVMGEVWREGVVIRRKDNPNISFKAKSPEYELRKGGSKEYPGKPIK